MLYVFRLPLERTGETIIESLDKEINLKGIFLLGVSHKLVNVR